MTTRRGRSRPFSILVAALTVCIFAAVGFRVGQGVRPSVAEAASTWKSAAAASYSRAETTAFRRAWQRSYARGWSAGTVAADSAGARAGHAAGTAQAAARVVAARALAAALAATPVKLTGGIKTERCLPVAGGLCEILGPRLTGKPCPPESVAFPEGGIVCIPRLLVLAARGAGSPNLALPPVSPPAR